MVCGCILGWWSVATILGSLLRYVCGCILGLRSDVYHFGVSMTLTSDIISRIIVFESPYKLFEVGISNLVCGCILWWQGVAIIVCVTVAYFTRIIESGAYLLYEGLDGGLVFTIH